MNVRKKGNLHIMKKELYSQINKDPQKIINDNFGRLFRSSTKVIGNFKKK